MKGTPVVDSNAVPEPFNENIGNIQWRASYLSELIRRIRFECGTTGSSGHSSKPAAGEVDRHSTRTVSEIDSIMRPNDDVTCNSLDVSPRYRFPLIFCGDKIVGLSTDDALFHYYA